MEKTYKRVTKIRMNPLLDSINVYIIFSETTTGIIEIVQEPTGILIKNPEVAKYHKFVYELLLKGSKKVI